MPESRDLLADHPLAEADRASPWMKFVLNNGDCTIVRRRDLICVQCTSSALLLSFTGCEIRLEGDQLDPVFRDILTDARNEFAESKCLEDFFERPPGTVVRIQVAMR